MSLRQCLKADGQKLLGLDRPKEGPDGVGRSFEVCETKELHFHEPGGFHELFLIPDRDRAAYSLTPGIRAIRQVPGKIFL